jgi:hypothetical protein
VININTLIAAYDFGNELVNTSIGSTLYQLYGDLMSQLSPETWSLYITGMKTCRFSHYYSFECAYKMIEAIASKNEISYKKCFIELRDCEKLQTLIEKSNQIARESQKLLLHTLAKLPSKEKSEIFESIELYRAWMNVFYHLHSTKLFAYMHKHKDIIKSKQENTQQYLELKKVYPFSKHNRLLIKKLAEKETDIDIMYFYEFFDSLRNLILQIIFETHFNRSLKLNKGEAIQYREKELNNIRVLSTRFYMTEAFKNNGMFILLFDQNTLQDIGLITRTIEKYKENGEKPIKIVKGILYPRNDYHLFLPYLTESRH